jgi:hypothetical protein
VVRVVRGSDAEGAQASGLKTPRFRTSGRIRRGATRGRNPGEQLVNLFGLSSIRLKWVVRI